MYEEEKCSDSRVAALLRAGADPNAKYEDGQPLLHRALAYQLSLGVIRLLVRARANVNATDKFGNTALMTVALSNDKAIEYVNILVRASADVNASNHDGWTALMHVAYGGHDPQIVRTLLQSGADVNLRNRNGETALAILEKKIAESKRQGYSFPYHMQMLGLLRRASELSQSPPKQPGSISKAVKADIRRFDFLNFTYHSSICSQELEGAIGKTVSVRNGKFKNNDAYFDIVSNIFGDVTGDGLDEAIIHTACGYSSSPSGFYISEVFIYSMQNGSATLLAELNDNDMQRDYRGYYPKPYPASDLFRIVDNGVKVINGYLIIERFAEGSMANPQYVVTLEYRWNNRTFTLSGSPKRRVFRQSGD